MKTCIYTSRAAQGSLEVHGNNDDRRSGRYIVKRIEKGITRTSSKLGN